MAKTYLLVCAALALGALIIWLVSWLYFHMLRNSVNYVKDVEEAAAEMLSDEEKFAAEVRAEVARQMKAQAQKEQK